MSDVSPPTDRDPQYLYVCVSKEVENPPDIGRSREDVHKDHVVFLRDLFDRGLLLGSGPQQDETGNRYGGAVVILQNVKTIEEAREIANREPNVHEGLRTMEVFAWRRVWFGEGKTPQA
ncbi:MAG: YciI family protein [Alphaproteobacteria bacterium]|nr:YciI family protein [Alphaproteobacteria bacterium]